MFYLSGVESYSTEPAVENPELEVSQSTHTSNTVRPFRLWKPVAVASAAVLAIALLFHGFSHSTLKANQISQENNKGSVQPQVLIPAAQVIRKIGKADSETASKVLAKSRNDDDTFQEVVVRHFTQPSPRTALPNGGNKRRVVVD